MARKKGSSEFEGWNENPDEAAVEAEVSSEDEENPRVTLAEPEKPKEPELSPTTKAEMEAGRKALEEGSKTPKPKDDEPA